MIRYADDVVMGFDREDDAGGTGVLPTLFGKYGLTLHREEDHGWCPFGPLANASKGAGERVPTGSFDCGVSNTGPGQARRLGESASYVPGSVRRASPEDSRTGAGGIDHHP